MYWHCKLVILYFVIGLWVWVPAGKIPTEAHCARGTFVSVTLRPPKIPHGEVWIRTWASALKGRQQIAWDMTRPAKAFSILIFCMQAAFVCLLIQLGFLPETNSSLCSRIWVYTHLWLYTKWQHGGGEGVELCLHSSLEAGMYLIARRAFPGIRWTGR